MYTFPELIKNIRKEAKLNQDDLAKALDVSTVLIAMVETGQKEVSKKLLAKLAEIMDVHPSSITPFLFIEKGKPLRSTSSAEKMIIRFGEKMQTYLIQDRAKLLRKYAKT